MYFNLTFKNLRAVFGKAILTAILFASGTGLFAQCITPAAPVICAGTIQQLTANPLGLTPSTFTNTTATTIPASGNFSPYPTTVAVTGLPTTGISVSSVQINGLSHTFPADIDIVLVSPTGQAVVLMSDAGGANDYVNANFILKDGSPALTTGVNASGTYAPTNLAGADVFPAPGPGTLTTNTLPLSSFTGNMNGTWSLYGVDDLVGDFGSLNGWSITFAPAVTVTWTGGPLFTNAAATTPYVAGTNATVVYAMPTATATYTANFSAGTCAGNQTVTVTVNSLPTVTVTPATSCGSPTNTLTASGANTYTWTPAGGLSSTTGTTVIANPTVTTTYTVTGTITATGCQNTATTIVNTSPTASVLTALTGGVTFQLNEGFDAAIPPPGWSITNRSNPIGITTWQAGATAVFNAFDGAATSFMSNNFNTTTGAGTISNWLFTPAVNIKNGDVISFYTRAATGGGAFPDRLQLRMSTNGASTNVGATELTVGDFTALLVDVNPTLNATDYPEVWTKYQAVITGVTGTVSGRFAFRYFVTNGGPAGANSNFIGLDRVSYGTPSPVCANTVSNLAVNITGGVGPYTIVYNNGTNNITYAGYNSGGTINVTPSVTTTYTLVSVTSANGCVGSGNSGSATISITPPVAISTPPAATSACIGGNATISAGVNTTAGTTYQYQVSTDGGLTYTNIANGGVYSGATTSALTITGATAAMSGYLYRVVVNGFCGGNTTSAGAALTVNAPAVITTNPPATFTACAGNSQTLSVSATGNQLTYQWQVSTNGGTTFTNIANGANYSGATTSTLTILNVPATFATNQYRVVVSSGGCAGVASSASTLTTVNASPVTVISSSPSTTVIPGTVITLTAATTPSIGTTYQWFLNGVAIPGATNNTLVVGINGLGTYTVQATNALGCFTTSSTPVDITVNTTASTTLFIYPSPNSGVFQVRYYNSKATVTAVENAQLNIFDSKGSRVFTRQYTLNGPYTQMNVDLGIHGKGIYRVELSDAQGNRIQTGSAMVF